MTKIKRIILQTWAALQSPRFVFFVLVYLGIYIFSATWLNHTFEENGTIPPWAVTLWLNRPFMSPLFLVGSLALLLSTIACTWGRRKIISFRFNGSAVGASITLEDTQDERLTGFLRAQGFRGKGGSLYRYRLALWGGWMMHIGLIVLMTGILTEQAFHDSALFELTLGESRNLSVISNVFKRERGPLAPQTPPSFVAKLIDFDAQMHQPGYASDRLSTLQITDDQDVQHVITVDRAAGQRVGNYMFYQSTPSGYALNILLRDDQKFYSVHLQNDGTKSAFTDLIAPDGSTLRFTLQTEHSIFDRRGTGTVRIFADSSTGNLQIEPGDTFDFGSRKATFTTISRWGGFSYQRAVGQSGVWFGFATILLGCLLMIFPAGVAQFDRTGGATIAKVFVVRGNDIIERRWMSIVSSLKSLDRPSAAENKESYFD